MLAHRLAVPEVVVVGDERIESDSSSVRRACRNATAPSLHSIGVVSTATGAGWRRAQALPRIVGLAAGSSM